MKKILIFIMIIFFVPNVFATNTNVSSKVKYSTDSAKGTYKGDEIYLGGYNGLFSINHRYNGRLAMVSFYIDVDDYNFTTNHTYTITLNMATEDWRNHFMGPQVIEANSSGTLGSSLLVSNFRFVSMKQIKFNFKTDGSLPSYIFFRVYSTDYASPTGNTAITGVNNWNLSSIYINNNVAATPTPAPVTPAPTPTPQPSNKDIIDNATQNTQDIINNQNTNTDNLIENNNQNTTDVIENNNQNTDRVIDSIKDSFNNCSKVDIVLTASDNSDTTLIGKYLTSSGSIGDSNVYNISTYIDILPDATYTLTASNDSVNSPSFCIYDSSKTIISCTQFSRQAIHKFSTNENAKYFRTSLSVDGSYTLHLESAEVCKNKFDELNDTMKDDSVDDKSSFFTDFEDNDFGLSSIITIPLTTIQQLTNTSCVALSVPIPFTNSNITLPCMTEIYQNAIPTIFNIWQIVSFGIISYFICIDIFKMVKGFKDPNEDKVEVLDL